MRLPISRRLLKRVFKNGTFFDENHRYQYSDDIITKDLISTTTVIGKLHEPFDEQKWGDVVGQDIGFDGNLVRKFWDDYSNTATLGGSINHNCAEDFFNMIFLSKKVY